MLLKGGTPSWRAYCCCGVLLVCLNKKPHGGDNIVARGFNPGKNAIAFLNRPRKGVDIGLFLYSDEKGIISNIQ